MSAQVLEVSEGIPTEGRMFETPQASVDNEQPRYVTFIGSLVDRQTQADRPWTKGGGIGVANPCLRYVKNFIRKGRITPVLKDTHDFRPADLVKKAHEGDTSFFPQVIPPGYVAPVNESGVPTKVGYMMGKVVLPGEQIDAIVNGSSNVLGGVRRGVMELKSLKGQPYRPQQLENGIYTDPVIWEMQRTIFPTYPILPTLLDDLDRLLDEATIHTSLLPIIDNMKESLDQFREYANATIKQTHVTMREVAGASNGYVPRYTAMDLILLEQLGLSRQDEEIRRNANAGGDPELREMFKAWMQANIEEKEALKASRVNESTMAAAPIEAGYDGYPGQPGQSGYSGYSGAVIADAVEHEVIVNDSSENAERIAVAMEDTLPNPVIKPEDFDLSGERPSHIHHKTWQKMRREAGLEE